MHVYFPHQQALNGDPHQLQNKKSLQKEELFTLEENLRWTSASSARLFFSWAQASPSVLKDQSVTTINDLSSAHPPSEMCQIDVV